jgi:hypothetical protein
VTGHEPELNRQPLAYGLSQRSTNLAMSLTTTSAVVAALDSVLAGVIGSDLAALCGASVGVAVGLGVTISLLMAVVHVLYAARFRRAHAPATASLSLPE